MRKPIALTAAAGAVAALGLAAAPAQADAATWRGKTSQDRRAVVRTGADGVVNRVRVAWHARCRREGFVYRTSTTFKPPLDRTSATSFSDGGPYRVRLREGLRARIVVRVVGDLSASGRRWSGSYRATVTVKRNGRRVDTCRARGISWRARR